MTVEIWGDVTGPRNRGFTRGIFRYRHKLFEGKSRGASPRWSEAGQGEIREVTSWDPRNSDCPANPGAPGGRGGGRKEKVARLTSRTEAASSSGI